MSTWADWLPTFQTSCNDKVSIYGIDKAYDYPPQVKENEEPPKGPTPFASDYDTNVLVASSKKEHVTGLLYYGQLSTILDAFTDTSDVKKVQSEGFWIGDDRYVCLRSDDQRLYGKLGKKGGFLCYKWPLHQMLVLCHYPAGIPDGNAVNDLELAIFKAEMDYKERQAAAARQAA